MAGTITALRLQKHDRARVNVFLDDAYAFALGIDEAAALRKGQYLTDDDIAHLRSAGDLHKAYHQALRYLGYRPRSCHEIQQYLLGKEYAEQTVATVVARLQQAGYADDADFVRFWIEDRTRFRPRSARALRHELRQKGVALDVIDHALGTLDEEDAAWSAVEGKLARWRSLARPDFDQKLIGFLSRRGFNYTISRAVCDRAWESLQQDRDPDLF